jgi:hypothetical protein
VIGSFVTHQLTIFAHALFKLSQLFCHPRALLGVFIKLKYRKVNFLTLHLFLGERSSLSGDDAGGLKVRREVI